MHLYKSLKHYFNESLFLIGDRVHSANFGYGQIITTRGDNLIVKFEGWDIEIVFFSDGRYWCNFNKGYDLIRANFLDSTGFAHTVFIAWLAIIAILLVGYIVIDFTYPNKIYSQCDVSVNSGYESYCDMSLDNERS